MPSSDPTRALQRFHFGASTAPPGTPTVYRPAGLPEALVAPAASNPPDAADLTPESDPAGGADPAAAAPESTPPAPLRRLLELCGARYQQAWKEFLPELARLARGVEALLGQSRADDPQHLEHALGALGARFVDSSALAQRLSSQAARNVDADKPLEGTRQTRLRATLDALRRALDGTVTRKATVVVEPDLLELGDDLPEGVAVLIDEDPCAVAASHFDAVAEETLSLFAAVRVARLEIEGAYDPELHDVALRQFDGHALRPDERLMLPSVVCCLNEQTAAGPALDSFSRLLRSRRRVQTFVLVDPVAHALEGTLELGLFAIGHRGCFVHQGAAGAPQAMEIGFTRALSTAGAALHLISSPEQDAAQVPTLALQSAAVAGRAVTPFVFDPESIGDDNSHFSLVGNPEPTSDWLQARESHAASAGQLPAHFTFADYALFTGRSAEHFAPAAAEVATEALLPLAEWLDLTADAPRHRLPFIWAIGPAPDGAQDADPGGAAPDGEAVRLVLSRRLALACLDRLDSWRTLRRLAGVAMSVVPPPVATQGADSLSAGSSLAAPDRQHDLQIAEGVVHRLIAQLVGPPPTGP